MPWIGITIRKILIRRRERSYRIPLIYFNMTTERRHTKEVYNRPTLGICLANRGESVNRLPTF